MSLKQSHRVFSNKNWAWFDGHGAVVTRPIQIPSGLYFLWSTIPTLQERFDISNVSGQTGLIAWWLVNGKDEYAELEIVVPYHECLYEPSDISEHDDLYPVSRVALATAQLNEYFLRNLDLAKVEDRIQLNNWYYGCIVKNTRQFMQPEILFFSEAVSDVEQDTYLSINYAMMLCWHGRKDLQVIFDLTNKAGRLGFEAWWVNGGYKHAAPYELTENHRQALSEKASNIEQDTLLPITRAMMICWQGREDLQALFDLSNQTGRMSFEAWWISVGHKDSAQYALTDSQEQALLEKAPNIEQDTLLPITRAMMLCWHGRKDLQVIFDLTNKAGRLGFEAWWVNGGYKDAAPHELTENQRQALSEKASNIEQDTLLPITRAMMLCWHGRKDLQVIFDLTNKAGRLGFEAWWVNGGYKDAAPHELTENQRQALSEKASNIEQDTLLPITRAMMLCWHGRKDLQVIFDLTNKAGRLGFEAWWVNGGYKDAAPHELTENQRQALSEKASNIEQDTLLPITRAMMICWHDREDLQLAFDLSIKEGRLGFEHWWGNHKNQVGFNYADSIAHAFVEGNRNTGHDESYKENDDINGFGGYNENGVNLIGLAKGELGIGEDVRMAAKAMGKADIEHCIFNFPRKSFSRQSDLSFAHLIQDELVYNVNMVNLTGFEHASLFATYGKKVFDKRFTIGAWPWELPVWPVLCNSVYNLVDEVWASTRYAVKAYSDSPVPVVHMPMTVDFDSVPQYTRSNFGLPKNVYLFLYVFDGLSYMARKNPIAHIKAFWNAFPRSQKDVGLIVKTMNANLDNEIWHTFHKMAASDERIRIISNTFSKNKVLGLMNNCDAFLSLHRAEGFGRCIAEMMWLGKPVIVTNFSGNTDFTTSETAFLVDGQLVAVKPGEYPYGEGQYWCDPDVGQAVEHMRTCYERGALVDQIADAGCKRIHQDYSVETVAGKYKERLRYLGIQV